MGRGASAFVAAGQMHGTAARRAAAITVVRISRVGAPRPRAARAGLRAVDPLSGAVVSAPRRDPARGRVDQAA